MSLPPPPPPGPAGLPPHPPTQPLPPLPPAPGPATSGPRRPRRWPWVTAVVVLTMALLAAVLVAVSARRDADHARSDAGAAARPSTEQPGTTAPGEDQPGKGDVPSTAPGRGDAPGAQPTDPSQALQDLLKGLLNGEGFDASKLQQLLQGLLGGGTGSGALQGVDPACLAGDDPSSILGGLAKGGGVSGTLEEQVTKIADLVQAERGLTFKGAVKPEFLPADKFDARIADMVKAEYPAEEADLDGRVLGLLGAVPTGTDMKALQTDLLSGQVAGFYDPDTGDIVVRVPAGTTSLDVNGQVTLAHELDHMLTDQRLGLPKTDKAGDSDGNLAALALTEGDATQLMEKFALKNVGLLDQLGQAFSPDAAASAQDLAKVPSYVRNELMFPYTSGLAYTCRLSVAGGWPAVDKAYKDLPKTSAEILFDGRGNATPVATAPVGDPGGSWQQARKDTFGAAPLQWLFQAPGGDEAKALQGAADLARHWAGGDLVLYTDGPRSALGLSLADTGDGGALCSAVRDWYGAAFGTGTTSGDVTTFSSAGRDATLRCSGRDVVLGIAPDAATAAALAS